MIEIYFVMFFLAGLLWGISLAPMQKPIVKNFFKIQMPEETRMIGGISSTVKQAKANLVKMEKGNA